MTDEWNELRLFILEWSNAYPEDVFTPLPAYDKPASRDCVAAAMGRHILKQILEKMDALEGSINDRT